MTQPDPALKRTPLHAAHVRVGARMIGFGGWDMPVQYAGIVEEHRTVRGAVGCFDVSHMGEFEFQGPDAVPALQRLTTNDVAALAVGQVQYSLLCYEDGGIVDDLTLYRLADDHYMMTVNASNIDKDWAWIGRHLDGSGGGAEREPGDRPDRRPGPPRGATRGAPGRRRRRRHRVLPVRPGARRRRAHHHLADRLHGRGRLRALPAGGERRARLGALLADGKGLGVAPIGLGARDTLRLEMKYALYGNDIDETTNPLEAGPGLGREAGQGRVSRQGRDRARPRGRAPAASRRLRDGRARRRPARLPDPPRRRGGRRW